MKSSLVALVAGAWLLSPQVGADFVTLWEIGTNNNGASELSQESFASNQPPGTVSLPDEVPAGSENLGSFRLPSRDDDYYFAGTYPDPIGVVAESEPWKAMERAMTDGDGTKRIHFTLDAVKAAAANRLKFTFDLFGLGSESVGAGTHNLLVLVNGQEIHNQADITTAILVEKTVTAGTVNAVAGENILEITRNGGTSNSWIQFDFLKAEIDTSLCSDPLCSFTSTATTVDPGGSVTLRWVASPSSTLTLNPGAVNVTPLTTNGLGSIVVTPSGTTTYILTANKSGVIQTQQVTVNVSVLTRFVSNRISLSKNEAATLSWLADPLATLTIDQGIGSVNAVTGPDGRGSLSVQPGNTEKIYTLTATRGAATSQLSVTLGYDQFGIMWQLGADNNDQADFSQESFAPNPPPGRVSLPDEVPAGSQGLWSFRLASRDDDYYFAGTYPDPIGVVADSEPPKAMERAMTDGDGTKRIHFTLDAFEAAATNRLKFTIDLFEPGSDSVGAGTHDVRISVNGQEIHSETGIFDPILVEETVTAGVVNAVAGENILEISRTGGTSDSWIQFDFLKAEIDTNPLVPLVPLAITGVTRNPLTREITLTWTSSSGSQYLVESSTDLVTWPDLIDSYPVGGATGASTSYSYLPPAGATILFYRVTRR